MPTKSQPRRSVPSRLTAPQTKPISNETKNMRNSRLLFLAGFAASVVSDPIPQQARQTAAAVVRRQGVPSDCTFLDTATAENDDCEYFANLWGITVAEFIAWNPSVGADCSGITVGREYCVERNWGVPVPTTSTRSGVPEPTSTVPSPVQEGIIDTCTSYYKALDGDDCSKITARFGFTLADFIQWNPAVDEACAGFWLGYYYCVATPDSVPTTTTGGAVPTATSSVPSPVQEGIIDTCTSYYKALDGDDCSKITARFGFTLADFIQWNPAVDKTCAGFWLGYYYCVSISKNPTSTLPTGPAPTATVIEGTSYPLPPGPTGTGTTAKCKTWYVAQSGDSCEVIARKFSISKTQVNIWNSYINIACNNIWTGNALCVSSTVDKSYWTALGCYTDGSSRALAKQIILPNQNSVMTPKVCQDACAAAGYKYAGLEYAHQCWCDNTIRNNHGPAITGCTAACPGEPTLKCGGDDRLNIFRNDNYADLGCFNDAANLRTLQTQIIIPNQNSILTREICHQACDVAGFVYSGVEYAHQCWCDNAIHGSLATGGCTSPCAGNSSQMCGGSDRDATISGGYRKRDEADDG
ncbi:hypothetical protein V492_00208 [Pseudogymnoascus sp. VKM F-4246]|nr:hypothetical protein V492_00208 [Pseudogymnoascus sp. VKM F-4246]